MKPCGTLGGSKNTTHEKKTAKNGIAEALSWLGFLC